MKQMIGLIGGLLVATGAAHAAATLRIGLGDHPNLSDPVVDGSYSGRTVFAALCDRLIDIDHHIRFAPHLATRWDWSADKRKLMVTLCRDVKFPDGELVDAEILRMNLRRYRNAPESLRKNEVKPIASIEVINPHPYGPSIPMLAERARIPVARDAFRVVPDELQ